MSVQRVLRPGRRPALRRCLHCRHRGQYVGCGEGRYVVCINLGCGMRTRTIRLPERGPRGWTMADHYRQLDHQAAAIWNHRVAS